MSLPDHLIDPPFDGGDRCPECGGEVYQARDGSWVCETCLEDPSLSSTLWCCRKCNHHEYVDLGSPPPCPCPSCGNNWHREMLREE